MHVVVQRRAEAVQEGDAAESRAGGCGGGGVNRHVCRSAQQPLDLSKKDLRESGDGRRPIGEKTPQSLRHGNHPLPHGHRRDDVIGEMGYCLGHVPTVTGGADAPSLAGERDDEAPAAAGAQGTAESEAEQHALEIAAEFLLASPPTAAPPSPTTPPSTAWAATP